MKTLSFTIFLSAALIFSWKMLAHAQNKNPEADGFAVVELFTSEGCSSCPAADAVINRLEPQKNVIVLAFHVDYWNYLGWKDRFSSHENSLRQQQYGNFLGLNTIYTPQVIVNGTEEFVGSDENKLHGAIQSSLKSSIAIPLTLQTTRKNNTIEVSCNYSAQKNCTLSIALVQLHANTAVGGGENKGRKLAHSHIVRNFVSAHADGKNTLTFVLPADMQQEQAEVVALIQNNNDGKIIAAAKTEVDK